MNCCPASGEKARPAAELADGPARLMKACVTNLPSSVNTCTRRLGRSATYTSSSFDTFTECTGPPNCCGPVPSVSSGGAVPRPRAGAAAAGPAAGLGQRRAVRKARDLGQRVGDCCRPVERVIRKGVRCSVGKGDLDEPVRGVVSVRRDLSLWVGHREEPAERVVGE